MRATVISSLIFAGGVLLSGCATVTRGTTEPLAIQSEPDGAKVEISSGQTGVTPCSFELKRKNDYRVYLRKDGFQPVEIQVESRVAGAGATGMAGNVLVGGIIGMGVDAATGATNSLRPNPVHVHLVVADRNQADTLCAAPGTVPGAICRGQLKVGASMDEVQQLLGPPQAKSRGDHEWQYGHDTVVFNDAGWFESTIVAR